MSIILMAIKAISLIFVSVAAFLALAGALGADLGGAPTAEQCNASTPQTCLFMIM